MYVLAHDDYLLLDALEAAARTPTVTVDGATAARAVLGGGWAVTGCA